MYNPSTSDHFYSTDPNDRYAPGYSFEYVSGYVLPATAVYWNAPSPN